MFEQLVPEMQTSSETIAEDLHLDVLVSTGHVHVLFACC